MYFCEGQRDKKSIFFNSHCCRRTLLRSTNNGQYKQKRSVSVDKIRCKENPSRNSDYFDCLRHHILRHECDTLLTIRRREGSIGGGKSRIGEKVQSG